MAETPAWSPLAGHGWRWLDDRGLQSLGTAALAALAATTLFAGSGLIRSGCTAACPGYVAVPAGILDTLGSVGVLLGLAAAGHWIGHLMHRTWLERLRLELADMELQDEPDLQRQRRLRTFGSPQSDVAQIHARGRTSLWAGLPVALASLVVLPQAMDSFGDIQQPMAFLLPLVALAFVAGLAATIRGISLLRAAKRLMAPRQATDV